MLWFQKAEVAELVDALDSGSSGMYVLWGFKSPLRHQPSSFIVVEARIPVCRQAGRLGKDTGYSSFVFRASGFDTSPAPHSVQGQHRHR